MVVYRGRGLPYNCSRKTNGCRNDSYILYRRLEVDFSSSRTAPPGLCTMPLRDGIFSLAPLGSGNYQP